MNLLEQLLKQLAASGPDSPEVQALLAAIREHDPNSAAIAETLVAKWRGQRTSQSLVPSLSWTQWGAVGGGVGVLAALPWLQGLLLWAQTNVPLPHVSSPVLLLLVVALVGGLAGVAYSIKFHRGLALPSLTQRTGVISLSQLGVLNELAFGALAAVMTVWLAAIGLPPATVVSTAPAASDATVSADPANSPSEGAAQTETAAPPENLLSWSVLLGAAVSGWLGARLKSSRLERSLLQKTLAETVTQPAASEEVKSDVLKAPNAMEMASAALGKGREDIVPKIVWPRRTPAE